RLRGDHYRPYRLRLRADRARFQAHRGHAQCLAGILGREDPRIVMTTAAATEMPALAPAAAAPRRLRVLVADEALPFPPDSGKRLRTWHLLRRLARRHEVVLLCYGEESEAAKRNLAALGAAGIECHMVAPPPEHSGWRLYGRLAGNCFSAWPYSVAKHHSRRFQAALEELLRRRAFDLV